MLTYHLGARRLAQHLVVLVHDVHLRISRFVLMGGGWGGGGPCVCVFHQRSGAVGGKGLGVVCALPIVGSTGRPIQPPSDLHARKTPAHARADSPPRLRRATCFALLWVSKCGDAMRCPWRLIGTCLRAAARATCVSDDLTGGMCGEREKGPVNGFAQSIDRPT